MVCSDRSMVEQMHAKKGSLTIQLSPGFLAPTSYCLSTWLVTASLSEEYGKFRVCPGLRALVYCDVTCSNAPHVNVQGAPHVKSKEFLYVRTLGSETAVYELRCTQRYCCRVPARGEQTNSKCNNFFNTTKVPDTYRRHRSLTRQSPRRSMQ